MRKALLVGRTDRIESIRRYLPSNYTAHVEDDNVVIVGSDVAGWTLDGYVLPRLASGLYYGREVQVEREGA